MTSDIIIGDDLDAEELRILVLKVLCQFVEEGFTPHITTTARAIYSRYEPATFLPPPLYAAIANRMEEIGWELDTRTIIEERCNETIAELEQENYDR